MSSAQPDNTDNKSTQGPGEQKLCKQDSDEWTKTSL